MTYPLIDDINLDDETAADGRFLLPGGDHRPAAVLFFRGQSNDNDAIRACFDAQAWPASYRVCALDIDAVAGEVKTWFDVGALPAVAIVFDGAILALSHDCTPGASQALVGRAEAQRLQLVDDI